MHSSFGFYQKRHTLVKVALGMVSAGFAFHTIFLIFLISRLRYFPVTNLSESLCFLAWCITMIFLLSGVRYKLNALGPFILPLVSSLMIFFQVLQEKQRTLPPILKSGWVYFHGGVAFVAYAAFFLTFIAGILYLIQEKELRSKRFRFLYFRLPSLQASDELFQRSLFTGFVAMTLTIISGSFWARQAWGRFWAWDPKETAALATWIIYLFLIACRLSPRWRGKRAAYIGIIGFVAVLLTFCVNWGLHKYH